MGNTSSREIRISDRSSKTRKQKHPTMIISALPKRSQLKIGGTAVPPLQQFCQLTQTLTNKGNIDPTK